MGVYKLWTLFGTLEELRATSWLYLTPSVGRKELKSIVHLWQSTCLWSFWLSPITVHGRLFFILPSSAASFILLLLWPPYTLVPGHARYEVSCLVLESKNPMFNIISKIKSSLLTLKSWYWNYVLIQTQSLERLTPGSNPTPCSFQELQETHRHVAVWESVLLEHHAPGSLCDISHRTSELGIWDRHKYDQCPACQYEPRLWKCRFTNHTIDLLNQNLQDLARPSLLQQVLQVTLMLVTYSLI